MMNRELFVQKLRSIQSNLKAQSPELIEDVVVYIDGGKVKIQNQVFNKYYRCKNDIQKLQSTFAIEHDA